MKRCKYQVNYGRGEVARFSDWDDAASFARAKSGEIHTYHSGTGVIVGQFRDGKATPEFRHLDRASGFVEGIAAPL